MRERIGEVIIHLTLNKRKLKNGKQAAYVRVQHKAMNRYYTCHSEFSPREWERFEKCPTEDHPAMVYYRSFREAIKKLVREDSFSFTNLSQLMRRSRSNTIQDLILEYGSEFSEGKKFNTASVYVNLHSCVDRFLEGRRMPVSQFTSDRCTEFLDWLRTELGNGPTTINIKARSLTAVLERAVANNMIPKNPMKGVKRPPSRKKDLGISSASLSKLLNTTEEEIGAANLHWLQYWRASYYGNGMNVKDLLLLQRKDIREGEITFIRRKTKDSSARIVHVPITPPLNAALTAISGGKRYIVPELDEFEPYSFEEHRRIRQVIKNINSHLRNVCEILRIPEKVTTGTARHTFATRLLQRGVAIEYISDAMGHTKISTTQNYLDGYTNEQRRQAAKLLDA